MHRPRGTCSRRFSSVGPEYLPLLYRSPLGMTTVLASVMRLPVTLIVMSASLKDILGSSLDCDKSADQLPMNGLLAASRCWVAGMSAQAMLRIVASSTVGMNPSSALDTAEPHLAPHSRLTFVRSVTISRAKCLLMLPGSRHATRLSVTVTLAQF